MEEFTNGKHVNRRYISIALSQVNDGIDLRLRMTAVLDEDFHELSVNLAIEAEIFYLIILVNFNTRIGKICWVDFSKLQPFRTQKVDNLLEMVQNE